MDNVEKLLGMLQAYDVPYTKIRIGNGGDGGYIALKEICDKTPVVYSFGVGNDVGFELDWADRYPKTKIYLHDPYIDNLPVKKEQFSFRKFDIVTSKGKDLKFVKNSLLKIDIEGNEWKAFENIIEADVLNAFSQILVEFHMFHAAIPGNLSPYFSKVYTRYIHLVNEAIFVAYNSIVHQLCENFLIYHIHANNSMPINHVNGHWFPPLLEVSFVNQRFVRGKINRYQGKFPIEGLDVSNKSDRPDILNYYPMNGYRRKNDTVK